MKKHLKQTIKRISFDLIDRPSTVDRMEIDQDKIKELSENINEVGLLQPVLLRPIAAGLRSWRVIEGHLPVVCLDYLTLTLS